MVRFRSAPGCSNRVTRCGIMEGDIRQLQSAGLFLGGQIGRLKFSLVRHELELPFIHIAGFMSRAKVEGKSSRAAARKRQRAKTIMGQCLASSWAPRSLPWNHLR
jgi:hypothetical protein